MTKQRQTRRAAAGSVGAVLYVDGRPAAAYGAGPSHACDRMAGAADV